jgi:hypothetical protein
MPESRAVHGKSVREYPPLKRRFLRLAFTHLVAGRTDAKSAYRAHGWVQRTGLGGSGSALLP